MQHSSLFALLALFVLAAAPIWAVAPLNLVMPATTVSNDGVIDYGMVGPGQSFAIKISPTVREGNVASGKYLGRWDGAYATKLPEGWKTRPSGLYGDPLNVEVTVDPLAVEGDYSFSVVAEDENGADHIGGAISFNVVVHVRRDVLAASITPIMQEVGAGQPARFTVTLTNLGTAPDTFRIGAQGVKGWSYVVSEYLAPGATKTFNYEVVGADEAYYPLVLFVESQSSPQIRYEQPVSLQVRTNLVADFKATSHGVLLYPPIMLPVYSLAGILGLFFP